MGMDNRGREIEHGPAAELLACIVVLVVLLVSLKACSAPDPGPYQAYSHRSH